MLNFSYFRPSKLKSFASRAVLNFLIQLIPWLSYSYPYSMSREAAEPEQRGGSPLCPRPLCPYSLRLHPIQVKMKKYQLSIYNMMPVLCFNGQPRMQIIELIVITVKTASRNVYHKMSTVRYIFIV
jgi:hypothetical protein